MKRIEESKLLDIHPKEWRKKLNLDNTLIYQYRNLEHFKFHCKDISNDVFKGSAPYSKALNDLLNNKGIIDQAEYETIKNKVKASLLKRGLISESIYESYKYDVEGDIVDVAKVIAEDPMCCLVPNQTYKNYFYEMYINVTLPWTISHKEIKESVAKILATIQLLEQEHIYIKVNLVAYSKRMTYNSYLKKDFLVIVPIFSHKDHKTIESMSAVLNERTSRKFMFAIKEEYYGKHINSGYGKPITLPNCIPCYGIKEDELASDIINKVIVGGKR